MRLSTPARLVPLALVFAAACSDYQISGKGEDNPGNEDDDPIFGDDGSADTDPQDSGDAGTDTGTTEPAATEPIYINEGDRLWSWDPEGELVEIGAFTDVTAMTDIAIDPDGALWGCTFDSLYRIDPLTAQTSFVAALPEALHGLTFVSDGRMVGAGAGVWLVNTSTGRFERTLVEPGTYTTSGDIVGLPDGLLYWTVWAVDRGDPDRLVVVDPDGGMGIRGETEVDRVFGLGYAYGDLYGFTDAGDWVEINANLGGLTRQGPLPGNTGWWGATTNPVRW